MEENVGSARGTNAEKGAIMPEADMVAFRTSVSNHWSRKSAELMVMSWTRV